MPVNSYSTKGTTLNLLDKSASPATETKIGGITDMPSMQSAKGTNEDTGLGDTIRHYKMSLGEPPSISLTLYWDPNETPQNDLVTAHQNETEQDFLLKLPDESPTTEYEFKAIVTSFSTPYGGVGDLLQMDVEFQLLENDHNEIVTKNPSS